MEGNIAYGVWRERLDAGKTHVVDVAHKVLILLPPLRYAAAARLNLPHVSAPPISVPDIALLLLFYIQYP